MKEKMIAYLQAMLTEYLEEKSQFGSEDRVVKHKFYEMIGAKEMAESLIGEPVNLGLNGKVTVGF